MAQRGSTAEDMQDEIFRRMSADQKIKIGSDFSMMCLEMKLPEGTKIPAAYLNLWFKALSGRTVKISKLCRICTRTPHQNFDCCCLFVEGESLTC